MEQMVLELTANELFRVKTKTDRRDDELSPKRQLEDPTLEAVESFPKRKHRVVE